MNTHKHITIYDAETKRNKSISLKVNDFENEEKLAEHIKKLRLDQRNKNKEFRKIKGEIANNKDDTMIINTIKMPQINNMFTNLPINSHLDLILDKDTGNSTIIFGASKRGKSTLMMEIYKKYYDIDKDFISTLFSINSHIKMYKGTDRLLVSNCFNTRSQKYIKLQKYINGKCKNKYKFLNMFDDIINTKYTQLINQLIMTYRNSNMSTIMCLQYGFLLSKMNRSNINNIIIFGSNNNESIQDLINVFLKPYFIKLGYKTFDEQMTLFKYVTDNHGFFYVNPLSDKISFHRINL